MIQEKKELVGEVVSDAMEKTIRVLISRLVKHQIYGKYIKRRTCLHVHDESNEARLGDTVAIVSCRKVSKLKSWKLSRVVRKSN